MIVCQAMRYAPILPCSERPPRFKIVYRASGGKVLDTHPACFTHGMAEVDRVHAAAGMARCDLEPEALS